MKLQSVKIKGFKSFVEPTTINFQSNLIAIVGPNGCGKSNIIDAFRWVFGESSIKNIRGENSTDVIFSGNINRVPANYAQVILNFNQNGQSAENALEQFTEISVRRQIDNQGQNQYYINNAKSIRKDVINLFANSGLGTKSYSIIEQGTISELITSKPDEVKVFIENAAGIRKQKIRLKEAEQKYEKTLINLNRIRDLVGEISSQKDLLSEQNEKLQKYKKLKIELNIATNYLYAYQYKQYSNQIKALIEQLKLIEVKQKTNKDDELLLESQLNNLSVELEKNWSIIEQDQKNFYLEENQIKDIEFKIQNIENTEKNNNEKIQEIDKKGQDLILNSEFLTKEKILFEQHFQDRQNQFEIINKRLSDLNFDDEKYQQNLEQFNQQKNNLQLKVNENQIVINQATYKEKNLIEQLNEHNISLLQIDNQDLVNKDKFLKEIKSIKNEIEELNEEKNRFYDSILEIQKKIEQEKLLVKESEKKLKEQNNKLTQIDNQIKFHQIFLNDYLKNNQQNQNYSKSLIDDFSVQEGWEHAVENLIHFYGSLFFIQNEQNKISERLSKQKHTFLFNYANSLQIDKANQKNGITPLYIILGIDSKRIPSFLLQFYTFDQQENNSYLMQLEEGEMVLLKTGILIGKNWQYNPSAKKQEENFFSKKKIVEQLKLEYEKENQIVDFYQEQLNKKINLVEEIKTQEQTLKNEIEELNKETNQLNNQSYRLDVELKQLIKEQSDIQEHKNKLINKIKQIEQNLTSYKEELQTKLYPQKNELALQLMQLTQESENFNRMLAEKNVKFKNLNEEKNKINIDIEVWKNKLENIKSQIQTNKLQLEDNKELIQKIKEDKLNESYNLAQLIKDKNIMVEQHKQNEKQLIQKRLDYNKLKTTNQQVQLKFKNLKDKEINLIEQVNEQNIIVNNKENELNLIIGKFTEDFDYRFDIEKIEFRETFNQQTQTELVEKLNSQIIQLGTVNLLAEEEYDKIQQRLEDIETQKQDLEKSIDYLKQISQELDNEIKKRFGIAFDSINEKFSSLFQQTMKGGKAHLEKIFNEQNHNEIEGIKILCQFPGKKLSSIQLMSGGEKALVAIIFVLAIFEMNPAPFCLLDEIDAPLDDVNVKKLLNLIFTMSDRTQFILISHNKQVMSAVQQLIGITMEEPGVSKVVSVQLQKNVNKTQNLEVDNV